MAHIENFSNDIWNLIIHECDVDSLKKLAEVNQTIHTFVVPYLEIIYPNIKKIYSSLMSIQSLYEGNSFGNFWNKISSHEKKVVLVDLKFEEEDEEKEKKISEINPRLVEDTDMKLNPNQLIILPKFLSPPKIHNSPDWVAPDIDASFNVTVKKYQLSIYEIAIKSGITNQHLFSSIETAQRWANNSFFKKNRRITSTEVRGSRLKYMFDAI